TLQLSYAAGVEGSAMPNRCVGASFQAGLLLQSPNRQDGLVRPREIITDVATNVKGESGDVHK
ncbi:MAG: hypothetical protein ACRC46_03715, partial [Thermoguttaceae bacterium]